ncbi:NADPH:quinone reductase [Agrilutibacter solisilvae]|uniref:NADPH:quinone reductase n=1 Tax=Agrilutibacter solisilvae TaxID=2763317 RepID=A0A975ARD8_9GAMM|nr:NADPH:quinone reductase [Lysobacter solisilvae]QSX77764.1 NADPH:quinone reductase [Lysobacter solisilvae]
MKAASYTRTGNAHEVLSIVELERPEPGAGEVRVRIAWSGVNPSDVKSRAGTRSKTLPFPRVTPHSDGAGVIDAVGPQVPVERIGERVWIWNAAWGRADGTAAQWLVLPAGQAVRLPDNVDLEVGALLGIPALTAYHAVHMGGGVAGKRVLVAGGAGAVGHYAVQMAKLAGARQVIATVSSPEKAALARSAGADLTIDYRREDLPTAVLAATDGLGVDRIVEVDFAANAQQDFASLATGGDVVVYGSGQPDISVPFVPGILKNISVHFFIVYHLSARDRSQAINGLTDLLARGQLQHNIAARLPLDRIVQGP